MLKSIKLLSTAFVFTSLLSCNSGTKSSNETTKSSSNDTAMANNDSSKTNNEVTIFKATLKGSEEVPANPSTATGTSTLTYNPATKTFTDVTSYSGLTPSMGHIHKGVVGENGPVVFPFTNLASPITFNSTPLTDEQVNAFFKDSMYVNLHTTKYPGGEIRGQLIKQ